LQGAPCKHSVYCQKLRQPVFKVLFVFVKDRVHELSSPNTGLALCMEKRQVLKAVDAGELSA
jgi:hypothetical protein